jgi:hypothetical protein
MILFSLFLHCNEANAREHLFTKEIKGIKVDFTNNPNSLFELHPSK